MSRVTPIEEARNKRDREENAYLDALAGIDAAAEVAVDSHMTLSEFIGLCVQHYRKYERESTSSR
jgi:hypothetical protein